MFTREKFHLHLLKTIATLEDIIGRHRVIFDDTLYQPQNDASLI